MAHCLMLDVDGVLVTGRPGDGRSWKTDLQRDLGVDPEKLRTLFFKKHWNEIVIGYKDIRTVLDQCMSDIAPGVLTDDLIKYWFEMDSRIDEAVLEGVIKLRELGYPVYLATNQEHLRAEYLMQKMALANHVDGIVYSAQIGAKKPDPAFFKACEKRVGLGKEDLVLIDDTTENVRGALQAGWHAVHWDGSDKVMSYLRNILS